MWIRLRNGVFENVEDLRRYRNGQKINGLMLDDYGY